MHDNSTLIFLHVQKCGGTTLRNIIARNYEHTININDWEHKAGWKLIDRFDEMSQEEQQVRTALLQQYQAIVGHAPFGLHTLLDRPYTYITMLREPVDRLVSLYEYWRGSSHDSKIGKTLEEFCTTVRFGWIPKDNHMVRVFNGSDGMKIPYGAITKEHVEIAKHNLSQCAFVGLTEEFDESLARLQAMFGWKNISYKSDNVNRARSNRNIDVDIDNATRAALEDRVCFDKEIYEYARECFTKDASVFV